MRRLVRRVWYALRQRRCDADLREELAFHREMKRLELERAGASTDEAAFGAWRALGNDLVARDRARDVWIWPWLQDLALDVRVGARLLVKDRRLTVAAVAALALGLGATTTAFTFVNGAILRDLPLADPDRLVWMESVDIRGRQLGVSYADVRDWREATRTLSHIVVSLEFPINLAEDALPAERYHGSISSTDVFGIVGREPILGRGFRPDDGRVDAPRVAIIAHTVWQSRYGGDSNIIGRAVRVNDAPATIIGVMPEGFHFPAVTEIWLPNTQASAPPGKLDAVRGNRPPLIVAFGRLAERVPLVQAQAEMDAVAGRLARDHPATNEGVSVRLHPVEHLYKRGMKQTLLLVMGAVSFVLLIACVNVANLLLARAVHRGREIAIRASLGATRWRLIRQLFVESVLLVSVSGALGLLLSLYGVRAFEHTVTQQLGEGLAPFWMRFAIDGQVYAFLALVSLGASVVLGLVPALCMSLPGNRALKGSVWNGSSGAHAWRWTGALVVSQLALTLVLLAGTGLMLRSFLAVYEAGRVLDPTGLITARLTLSLGRYPQPEQIKQFYRQLDERLASVPALFAVTIASDIPMRTVINASRQVEIDGRAGPSDDRPLSTAYLYIGPRYFETLRLRLLRGREFTDDDGAPGRETVIVNERFAAMFFPDADPIGQRIRLANASAPHTPRPWFTIVGIAPTVPQIVVRERPEPVVYVPVRGEPAPHRFVSVIARSKGDHAGLISLLREEVRRMDPGLPLYSIQTMDDILAVSQWQYRVFGTIFALLAAIALLLASVGLYAVTAHDVSERTQEIGVRVALGSNRAAVVWLFVRRTVVQIAIGLIGGLAGALVVGRFLERSHADPYAETFLVRTAPTDPMALGLVCVLLIVVAITASVWPARRAASIDPIVALRHE